MHSATKSTVVALDEPPSSGAPARPDAARGKSSVARSMNPSRPDRYGGMSFAAASQNAGSSGDGSAASGASTSTSRRHRSRVQRGEATCRVAAHGVTHDVDGTEIERRPERCEVVDERLPRVVVTVSALTVAALVEHEHTVPACADRARRSLHTALRAGARRGGTRRPAPTGPPTPGIGSARRSTRRSGPHPPVDVYTRGAIGGEALAESPDLHARPRRARRRLRSPAAALRPRARGSRRPRAPRRSSARTRSGNARPEAIDSRTRPPDDRVRLAERHAAARREARRDRSPRASDHRQPRPCATRSNVALRPSP